LWWRKKTAWLRPANNRPKRSIIGWNPKRNILPQKSTFFIFVFMKPRIFQVEC